MDAIITITSKNQASTESDVERGKGTGTGCCRVPTLNAERGRSPSDVYQHTGPQVLHSKSARWLLAFLLVALGGLASTAFLITGILDKNNSSQRHFEQRASDISNVIQRSWHEYEMFGLWAHESCHKLASSVQPNSSSLEDILHMCSREEFRNLFENILSTGLGLFSLQYAPLVEHRYRQALEEESRVFLEDNFPYINYTGIQSFETTADGDRHVIRSPDKPFYFPVHHVEPMIGNEPIYEMDTYSASFAVIVQAIENWKPVLSGPYKLYLDEDHDRYSVVLVHPGANSSVYAEGPHAVIAAVVHIPDLLAWAAQGTLHEEAVYLYDSTDGTMHFLGGAETRACESCQSGDSVTSLRELAFEDIPHSRRSQFFQTSINVVDRQWTIAVVAIDRSAWANYTFVILGGAIIFVLFFLLALLFKWYLDRIHLINKMSSKAEADKADNAIQQANRERCLNEYLAHEVRNPLASAMAALTFVSEHTLEFVDTESTRKLILDDAHIVDSSLNYINDLLRSMLDIAANGKLETNTHPTNILRDVLEPAAAALSVRNTSVEVLTDCPVNLVVHADQLRLKQIIMNLSINSTKFVERGFIRLRASVVDGGVFLFVEDSGPGVPLDKRTRLFESFQESLDLLNQGIGLSICQKLCTLMGAEIRLDESYDSGLRGSPGARFVVDLQQSPCTDMVSRMNSFCEAMHESARDQSTFSTELSGLDNPIGANPTGTTESHQLLIEEPFPRQEGLPESLRVLFVDDETILRRLFMRTIHKVAPSWHVSEATNGNQALQLVEEQDFDLIFMDQYMPCEKPILGTDVVRIWRLKGVSSLICGVSANDMKHDFLKAGADGFILKPFPCKKDALQAELVKLWRSRHPKEICVKV
jgi:signal transduction histidine kinase/CheY-like chemotaxis protein